VNIDAAEDEIKASYKRLALMFHPDKNIGNLEAEKKVRPN
jgi:DnaJ-class molecular chaperone